MKDEELLRDKPRDDRELVDHILEKYKPLVIKHANRFFIMGGETQDLIQEGMIGLYHAILDFDPDRHESFLYFADLCVRRQMYHAIESAAGQHNRALNSSMSLDDRSLTELFDIAYSTEEMVIEREELAGRLVRLKGELSEFENKVLLAALAGLTTAEISEEMNVSAKQADNAMTRIKQKARNLGGDKK